MWKAVFGLLGKIATSPFTLLGKLFGGDAGDLSSLAFAPGSSSLEAVATPKLQALAKALQERPELRLDAEGAWTPTRTLARPCAKRPWRRCCGARARPP
ncbi:MAG: hypothetical protein IPO28_15250 [Holophagaceae bacterium]|nr:hypothetical protein [Holophagaceae bacterium]